MGEKAKYVVVRELLADRIAGLRAGDRLPPEGDLCAEYGVSRITLRRAVEDLTAGGLLSPQQGRGTFVTEPPAAQPAREVFANKVNGFYRQQSRAGNRVETRVLRNSIRTQGRAAASLGLLPRTDLIQLDRVRKVNGSLQQFSSTWLEAARFPRVLVHDFSRGSLYEFLEETYGVVLVRNDLLVKVGLANTELADALGVADGEPLLAMESTVFAIGDAPVAFGVTHFTPEHSEILISLRDTGGNAELSASVSPSSQPPAE